LLLFAAKTKKKDFNLQQKRENNFFFENFLLQIFVLFAAGCK